MADYLESFPKPFLQDLAEGRCLPFIGAGFSLNAVIPAGKVMLDWDNLGKKAAESLPEYQYTTALEALSAYCHEYSRVKLVEFLTDALLITQIQPSKVHEEFCQLPFERIVTTNFDFLLEQAYGRVNRYCIPQIVEEQLSVANASAGVLLLKLHGDLHHPNRLVVTEEDYDTFLARLPLLATYLSSLLIGHTAFFIGYSLDDPDFRQIWQVVKERLGVLRRPAYVLQVGAAPHAIARYERRGVKVINLPKVNGRSYAETLEYALRELREYWSAQVIATSTTTEPESQAELSLPRSAQTRLAYFAVPTKYASLYKAYVYPIAERYGFSPVMAVDVVTPGDNTMAKIYALLERAAVVVGDISTPFALSEVGMALSQERDDKRVILIADEVTNVPFDLRGNYVVIRHSNIGEESEEFVSKLEDEFAKAFAAISPSLQDEPNRLIAKKEYRAAIIAVFSSLEHELRQFFERTEGQLFVWRSGLTGMLSHSQKYDVLNPKLVASIKKHSAIRNQIAHSRAEVPQAVAKNIVADVSEAIAKIRAAADTIQHRLTGAGDNNSIVEAGTISLNERAD